MIIVSQNGKQILIFEKMLRIYIDGRTLWADYNLREECIGLGTYADEDRAKLVLRQIVDCYSSYQATEGGPVTMYTQSMRFTPPKVFEMPEC